MKSSQAVQRGRHNKEIGDLFENLITTSCEYYRVLGVAIVEKTPEPLKVERPIGKGKFICHFEKKAQPDFKGTVGDKCIVFDAKATMTEKISLDALTVQQLCDLSDYANIGAEAGVFMCFGFKRFIYMPIGVFIRAKELNGHKHWTADEAARHGKEITFTGSRLKMFERKENDVQ